MKIYLYLNDKICIFSLSHDVVGSYSFDYESDAENKLINVEAKDDNWYLYSTIDANVLLNGSIVNSLVLVSGNFYTIRKKNKDYLIYFSDLSTNNLLAYSYDKDINLLIGNDNSNVQYKCFYLEKSLVKIYYDKEVLVLDNNDNVFGVYVNNMSLKARRMAVNLGDQINIYGLKIIFLKDFFLVHGCINEMEIDNISAKIQKYSFSKLDVPENVLVGDNNLYEKWDYFSKSPRIRRVIETKKVKLSPPPKDNFNQELPMILTIGPMLTMGITSGVTLLSTILNISSGKSSVDEQWPSLLTSCLMLFSMLVWPILIQFYNKKMSEKKLEILIAKYRDYLSEKRSELSNAMDTQRQILIENLVTVEQCVEIIRNRSVNFWDKRIDQSDFLVVRIGKGRELFDVNIEYPEEGFTVEENELKKQADMLVEDFKYINDAPIGYSFYDNKVTAVMGISGKSFTFVSNILLQLITFYSYEDLKVVVFTQGKNKNQWDYIKYLNHNFSNSKNLRFFASDIDSYRSVIDFLNSEINNRLAVIREVRNFKPYYLIIIDDYDMIKRFDFINTLTEMDENIGFSIIILEDRLSKLPSKCNNFITLGVESSGVLKNSYEKQEQINFKDEINYNINMMNVVKVLANIPIEFEEGIKTLPDSITFFEMEKVGRVEQLNILNRWNNNDSTTSLKAEIGVDEQGDLMYLDLHEKYHGPHGLIAGTTGSGKSEFIITYILSMAINYSPDDVAFILIDYKGGGLALAFENKITGITLPHLAGTITNLDKSEMDRTLVSIDSEIKRRQMRFNEVRDKLGESTMDIYKYQRFYKEGRISGPIPHLFIICDEFAELKSQQPEFMDNLISVARIGRSLGVHLILATQKPSGVVNDQIWSNTKFRVCLKVQDESDSKEMLKRTEAAGIKQVGRFYLQVGYDEYFALGQSAWCGAKYYPSDTIVKQVDKSINFINDCGMFIKSIQGTSDAKKVSQGEQLAVILQNVIDVSNKLNKRTRRLWLENIPSVILVSDLEHKYKISHFVYHVVATLGEYDAPEEQSQGIVNYDYLEQGNTIIYGNDGLEREKLIDTMVCSTVFFHKSEEINYYFIDFGSEAFVKYSKLCHVGGVVVPGEDEKYNNLLKFLGEELKKRKKIFADYGGDYNNYMASSPDKLPLIVVIINNYDSVYESNPTIYEVLPELVRDSYRYGIIYIISCNAINSVQNRISTNFNNIYAFKLKDSSDYSMVFGTKTQTVPRNIFGRGLLKNGSVHEFQTASLVRNEADFNNYLTDFISSINNSNSKKASVIPTLPGVVRMNNVNNRNITLNAIPVGIAKDSLEVVSWDFLNNVGNIISSNKITNTFVFVKSLISLFLSLPGNVLVVIDPLKELMLNVDILKNYYVDNFDAIIDQMLSYVDKLYDEKSDINGVILIYGLHKLITKISNISRVNDLIESLRKYEKISLIVVDDCNKIKNFAFESWFSSIFSLNDGIWIGKGIADQNLFRLATVNKEMTVNIKNDMGYVVSESNGCLVKLIDFVSSDKEGESDG